ncbi:MAG: MBL fold metallo-hydrolase [Desulfuromonadales bacterium]|nr:MBL fold metallo-hydrolase [Desulfuromonadales bacterium]
MWRILLTFIITIYSTTSVALAAGPVRQEPSVAPAVAVVSVQGSFQIEPLAPSVFAAIAKPGGNATTNALFVIGRDYVVAAGAHMSKPVIDDLYKAIAARTSKPVRYFVLAHHHTGYTYVDFDFPPGQDVLMSWQTWKNIEAEVRDPEYSALFFNEGLTLKPGGVSVVLTNIGKGHTNGDIVVFIPEAEVVFASDLLYVNSVGYMGDGYMTDWLLALDFLEQMGARQIIPGYGPVSSTEQVYEFGQFFRDFLTAVLQHIERGETLEQTLASFDLPQYHAMDGYDQLIKLNLKRAYNDLSNNFTQ